MAVARFFGILFVLTLALDSQPAYADCDSKSGSTKGKQVRLAVSGGSPSMQTVVFKAAK